MKQRALTFEVNHHLHQLRRILGHQDTIVLLFYEALVWYRYRGCSLVSVRLILT